MVTYLASLATTSISIITSEVATNLTISAPTTPIIQGQSFIINGVLTRADTGVPLVGEEISLSYNGTSLGTALTQDLEGSIKYQAEVSIAEVGEFTLTASFAGATRPGLTLGASTARTLAKIPGFQPISPYLGIIAVGLALIGASVYSSRR